MQPKILLLDIETAPHMAYIWSLWQKFIGFEAVQEHWYILCWCAKWLDEKEILSSALPDFSGYDVDPSNDHEVMAKLWTLLDEADIVIAHNAVGFDIKRVNTRFLVNGMKPPSPYKVVDTLKVARRHFAFTSNKLDSLGKLLGLGKKVDTGGFQLWIDCLNGDLKAWDNMVTYCKQDVRLLENVYRALLPYASNMPNMGVFLDEYVCPKCGSDDVQKRGFSFTNACRYQRWVCNECGGWSRSRAREKLETKPLASL